ncbi:MAG: ATP-binding protein [Desulfurococcaceae archaeon]
MKDYSLGIYVRLYGLIVINISMLITLKTTRDLPSLTMINILNYAKVSSMNTVIYLAATIFHILVTYILLNDILLTYINRVFVIAHAPLLLKDIEHILTYEVSLLILIPILLRLLGVKIETRKSSLLFKQLATVIIQRKRERSFNPILFSTHALGVALYQLTLTQIMGGLLPVIYNLTIFTVIGVLIPALLLVISITSSGLNTPIRDTLTTGISSGFGLLGLTAFLMITNPGRGVIDTRYSRVYYSTPVGIKLGEAKYILSYDYPSDLCIAMENEIAEKKWCWRRIHQLLYIKLEELNTPHIVITGASGSGKTRLAKNIVMESHKKYGYNIIIVDQHGEYKDISQYINANVIDISQYSINPLSLENSSPRERALQFSHIMSLYFRLGFKQRQLLEELILETYESKGIKQDDPNTWKLEPPTIKDLVITCKNLSEKISEYTRILPYLLLLSETARIANPLKTSEFLTGNVIIDLSKISDDFTRIMFIDTLMYLLINNIFTRKLTSRIQLLIEEAREIMPREFSRELLSRLFAESRKFGFSIIIITQELERIPRALINNAGLRVFFVLNEPEEIEEAAKIIAGTEPREKTQFISETIRTLDPGVFIVHATGTNNIYMVKLVDELFTEDRKVDKSSNL